MTTCDTSIRVWHEEFQVHSYEIGPTGYATPQALCRFIQEAASNHVFKIGISVEEMLKQKQMWVLANMSFRMENYPHWRETLRVKTWPVYRKSKLRGYRDFDLRDEHDRLLGRASTLWLLLDQDTRKPLPLPEWFIEMASPGHEPEFITQIKEEDFERAAAITKEPESPLQMVVEAGAGAGIGLYHDPIVERRLEFVIRASDIDWNLHVNNVSYLEWALEGMSAVHRLSNKVAALDMTFVAEGKFGNSIVAECAKTAEPDNTFIHRICEKSTGKPLALLRIGWQHK